MLQNFSLYTTVIVSVIAYNFYDADATTGQQEVIARHGSVHKLKGIILSGKVPDESAYFYDGDYKKCGNELERDLRRNPTVLRGVQRCCNYLKNCDDSIPTTILKYGIQNNADETLHNCMCISRFRQCLKKGARKTQNPIFLEIGKSYFNVARPLCLLNLYSTNCDGYYYNNKNQSFENNDEKRYFCPTLYEVRPF